MSGIENGKPEKDCRDPRTRVISVRLSEAERSRIAEEVKKSGLTFSAFARKRILGRRVATNAEIAVLEGLRVMEGQLNKPMRNRAAGTATRRRKR